MVIVLFRDTLLMGGGFFKRDIHIAWLPQVEAFVRAVAAGSWPVWDPSPAFGQPLLADPGAQVLYPFAWLNLLMKPWVYYTWFAASHCLFSAVCVFLLARRWRLSRFAAFTSSILWLVSGPYLSIVDLWHHFASASWMPAVVLAFDRAADRRQVRSFLLAGVTLSGQVLAGSADLTAITLAVVFGLIVLRMARGGDAEEGEEVKPRSLRGPRTLVTGTALALAVAAGITACLWLPAADVASRSSRAGLVAVERTYWSVHPLNLLDIPFPGPFNLPQLAPDLAKTLFEGREPFIDTLYVGLATLPLVLLGMRSRHSRARLLWATTAACLVLALGRHTPVYDSVVTLIPPLQIFRFPVKVMVAFAFAWSLLGGIGCDFLASAGRAESSRRIRLPFLVLEVATAAAVVGATAILLFPDRIGALLLEPNPGASSAEMLAPLASRLLIAGTAGLAVLFASWRTTEPKRLAVLCGAFAMGELAIQHRDPDPVAPRAFFTYRPEVLRLLAPTDAARVYVYDYFEPEERLRLLRRNYVFQGREPPPGWNPEAAHALALQGGLAPETAGRWGVRQAYDLNYRGLFPKLLVELGRALRDIDGTPVHTRWLQLAGVTHVIALHRLGLEALPLRGTILIPDPLYVFGVPETMPRSYVVGGVRLAQGVDSFRILADPGFDLRSEVVLPPGTSLVRPPGRPGTVRILDDRPDRVTMEAELSGPGHLVLLDTYDPGWRATVDGAPARVIAANAIFRAVPLEAGRHVVTMVYRPRALLVGLIVTMVTSVALLLGLVATRVRFRREARAGS